MKIDLMGFPPESPYAAPQEFSASFLLRSAYRAMEDKLRGEVEITSLRTCALGSDGIEWKNKGATVRAL